MVKFISAIRAFPAGSANGRDRKRKEEKKKKLGTERQKKSGFVDGWMGAGLIFLLLLLLLLLLPSHLWDPSWLQSGTLKGGGGGWNGGKSRRGKAVGRNVQPVCLGVTV